MNVEHLAWDSDFFQLKIGKIVGTDLKKDIISNSLDQLKTENYQLIYWFSNELISELSSFLVDKKVIYEYSINQNEPKTINENILFLKEEDVNQQLLQLALQSGEYSRFRLDKHFPKGSFEKLYALWVQNSLNKKIADEVIIFKRSEQIQGMVTLKHETECSRIGLIAVDTKARGQKIGSILLETVKQEAHNKGNSSIEVATQLDNTNACNFYEKNHFKIKKVEYIYHIWL